MTAGRTVLIACGVFAPEFRIIDKRLRERFDPVFLDSMLHVDTEALDRRISAAMPRDGLATVLLYGDCSPHMLDMEREPGHARTQGCNCCEIVLGPVRYRELRKEGAFFMMPEWTERWEEIFKEKLGFKDSELTKSLMADTMKKIVYLDTGTGTVPLQTLEAISAYLGLPFEIEATGTGKLEESLRTALSEVMDAR